MSATLSPPAPAPETTNHFAPVSRKTLAAWIGRWKSTSPDSTNTASTGRGASRSTSRNPGSPKNAPHEAAATAAEIAIPAGVSLLHGTSSGSTPSTTSGTRALATASKRTTATAARHTSPILGRKLKIGVPPQSLVFGALAEGDQAPTHARNGGLSHCGW